MSRKLIRSFAVVFALVLTMSTVAFAASKSASNQSNGMNVSLLFDSTPVIKGENDFKITVTDSNKRPVSGVKIKTTFDMDRSKMEPMNMSDPIGTTLREDKPGEYTGRVNLSDKGDWLAKTNLSVNNRVSNVQFDLTVQDTGLNMLIVGGILGTILLAVLILLTHKKWVASSRKEYFTWD